MNKIRWGIIGPGAIAHNFADALKESYSGELLAIASRTNTRLEEFGNKYNVSKEFRFNDYDQLLDNENIDAVYISTPHVFHADLSIKAAGKGKHILCEKPGALNFKQTSEVIEKVREAGVFYKEGFMYRCHPQIPALINLIKNKTIGNINLITSSVGYKFMPDGGEFAHPAGIIFVTKDKIVSRYLSGVIFDPKDFKLALLEASEGTVGKISLSDKVLLYCYDFDPVGKKYALKALNVMKLGGAITLISLIILMVFLWTKKQGGRK